MLYSYSRSKTRDMSVLDELGFDEDKPFIMFFVNEDGDYCSAFNGTPIQQAEAVAQAVLAYNHERKVVLASVAIAEMEKQEAMEEGEKGLEELGFITKTEDDE